MDSDSDFETKMPKKNLETSTRKLFFDKIWSKDISDNFGVKENIEKSFKIVKTWPDYIIKILCDGDFKNAERFILALFFKFNNCPYNLAVKIINLYGLNKIKSDQKQRFLYIWYKCLNTETNPKIIKKYYYYDLVQQKYLFLDGSIKLNTCKYF